MKRLSVLAAVVLVVLMVHARGGSAVGVSPLASCDIDCTGINNGDKIPDPYNCTNFYYCNNGDHYGPVPCGSGHYEDGECVGTDECEPLCGGGANCPLTCNGTVTAIGDAFDCSVYYFCTPDGTSEPQPCPVDRPYYDGNAKTCSNDDSVCCSGYCTPYCTGSGFAFIPDPNSCTDFYACEGEGDVDENHHLSCASGEVFSVTLGDCVPDTGEPCQTLCGAAGGGDSTPGSGGDTTTPGSGGDTTTRGSGGDTTTPGSGGETTTPGSGGDTTTPGSGGSTDINGCVSSLVCEAAGNFPACSTCQPEYFHCTSAGASGELNSCSDDTVFNPNPEFPYCILPSNCPSTS